MSCLLFLRYRGKTEVFVLTSNFTVRILSVCFEIFKRRLGMAGADTVFADVNFAVPHRCWAISEPEPWF